MPQIQQMGLRQWLGERYPMGTLRDWAESKHVPQHRYTVWYSLGGMLLFMLGLQFLTGILLAFYYRPTEEAAYKSILTIRGVMPFGWVVRSLHAWTANVMIAAAFVHMFSVWLLRSFRKPRELTWVTGVLSLALLLAFGFSGYLLPWDELAFFATKVGTQIIGSVPLVGYRLMTFLRGGQEVSGDTLGRFFAFHVCVLPLLMGAVAGVHLLLIQVQGVSVPPSLDEKACPRIPFFPDFMLHDLRVWLLLFGLLVTLAVGLPWGLGRQADPLAPAPPGIRPEWYFLAMYQVFKLLPTRILGIEGEIVGAVFFLGLSLMVLAVPFLFRKTDEPGTRRASTGLVLALLLFFATFAPLGYVTSEREKAYAQDVATKAPLSPKPDVARLIAASEVRIEQERVPFLIYTLGLWVCIGFLTVTIHYRLAHAQRAREIGLGDQT